MYIIWRDLFFSLPSHDFDPGHVAGMCLLGVIHVLIVDLTCHG